MPFIQAKLTKPGGREINEDYCSFLDLGTTACWAVADGLGGHQAGETASRLAVEAVLNSFKADSRLSSESLACHFEAAFQAVAKQREGVKELSDMRTTLTVLLTDSKGALWGHVGDTRLYYLQGGCIVYHTKDHSIPQALATSGDISLEEIRHHPDRNRLLRSIGGAEKHPAEILIKEQTLSRGDVFLLCTDGFWEFVTESEMEVDFSKSSSPREWLSNMESRLAERAPEGNDNYTALAVFFDSPTAPPPPESPHQTLTDQNTFSVSRKKIVAMSTTVVLLLSIVYFSWKTWGMFRQKLTAVFSGWLNRSKAAEGSPPKGATTNSAGTDTAGKVYRPKTNKSYTTIAEAVREAEDGEEIWLGEGIYNEAIEVSKTLFLTGAGRDKTVINLPGDHPLIVQGARGSIASLTIIGKGTGPTVRIDGSFNGVIEDTEVSGPGCPIEVADTAMVYVLNSSLEGVRPCNCGAQPKRVVRKWNLCNGKEQ